MSNQITENNTETKAPAKKRKKQGAWVQIVQRVSKDRVAMIGLCGVILLVIICLCAPLISPYGYNDMDLTSIKTGPTKAHIFGTDELGRDYFTRLLYGGRYSLAMGFLGAIASFVMQMVVGCVAGYFGGAVDNIIMRLCDVLQAIPATLVSIIITMALGTNYFVTIFAIAFGGITGGVRMTRSLVLTVRQEEYLDAARTINCSSARIMFRHVLPNILSIQLLNLFGGIGSTIQIAANLSVIGLGIQPPTPEWGQMLSMGISYIRSYPHLVIFPGLFIFATSLLINLFGDGLRDAIDPKLKR